MACRLRIPFVVTVAASACGGSAVVDGGTSGSGAGGAGGSATSTSSASSVVSGVTSGSTSSGQPVTCPPTAPNGYTACDVGPGLCTYEVPCQSGVVVLQFSCSNGFWEIEPGRCVEPYDSCPGTEYYCGDGGWWMPSATNPPSPCPSSPPPEGEPCYPGGMGGVWEQCGYRCGPGPDAPWTIATCTSTSPSTSSWQYDGACG